MHTHCVYSAIDGVSDEEERMWEGQNVLINTHVGVQITLGVELVR